MWSATHSKVSSTRRDRRPLVRVDEGNVRRVGEETTKQAWQPAPAEYEEPESDEGGGSRSTRRDGTQRPETHSVRKLTLANRMARGEADLGTWLDEVEESRPKNRGECRTDQRPCPYVSCRYHLYLDVNTKNGSIKFNFPHLNVWELPASCALDVAEEGGLTLDEVGQLLNLTRERIRQFTNSASARLREVAITTGLDHR